MEWSGIGALEIDGMALGGVDIVAVDELVGPADGGAPALEDVLGAGVVGGVGVVVEVGLVVGDGELLIVPAQHRIDGGGSGEAGELLALWCREAHGLAEEIAEVLPVEILGLFDVDGP
jgi:hypothetical protein